MKNLNLITTMKCFHKRGHHVPLECHEYYELVYYRRGLGITKIDNKEISFYSNTFIVMPPNVWHDETHQADCELIYIRIYSDCKLRTGFFTDEQETIYKLANTIFEETIHQHVSYQEMISIKLNELFIALERLIQNTPGHAKNFEYVINYITESYNNRIVFKNLAEQLNFSYDYFQHRFKEITGSSPQQFLIHKRINAAETMLRNDRLSCTEIAYRCGFSNSAQFSAIFKREKGISPQQYRKRESVANFPYTVHEK